MHGWPCCGQQPAGVILYHMASSEIRRINVIDSHTGGEPTRVVIGGFPDLGGGTLGEQRQRFGGHFDWFRAAVVNEPRGSDVLVGALLLPPHDPRAAAGVIFFNNVGCLNMCGHGTIGLVVTLAHMGRIGPGEHLIETPVGNVTAWLDESGDVGCQHVTIENVASYRNAAHVPLDIEGHGRVHGDVAWGGNWFYLVHDHGLPVTLANVEQLSDLAWRIRQELKRQGVTGANGEEIDHIDLFGPPEHAEADSKNFVLCPGRAYDRSPCGTGTSAKLACLIADGKLEPGQIWRQEGIVGSIFEGSVASLADSRRGCIYPRIRGSAYVTGKATLVLDPCDPFVHGIPSVVSGTLRVPFPGSGTRSVPDT
jgi:4-hydroxyproline epimerase